MGERPPRNGLGNREIRLQPTPESQKGRVQCPDRGSAREHLDLAPSALLRPRVFRGHSGNSRDWSRRRRGKGEDRPSDISWGVVDSDQLKLEQQTEGLDRFRLFARCSNFSWPIDSFDKDTLSIPNPIAISKTISKTMSKTGERAIRKTPRLGTRRGVERTSWESPDRDQ